VIRYTARSGATQTRVAPFLPEDGLLTSQGVVAFPDANAASRQPGAAPAQVAFAGVYLPTVPSNPLVGRSAHPAERDPRLMLVAYQGDLGLESGRPRSVYELDPGQIDSGRLVQVGEAHLMKIGETWRLPDGSTVEFLGARPWVTVSVRHDPGSPVVLGGAVALLLGLMVSLTGKRRRVWARVEPASGGRSLISLGGLTRSEHPGFAEEFGRVAAMAGADPGDRGADDATRVGVGKVADG
jgi:cytochrome c biogenesis protein